MNNLVDWDKVSEDELREAKVADKFYKTYGRFPTTEDWKKIEEDNYWAQDAAYEEQQSKYVHTD